MSKRDDYISWDEYFMGEALLAAQRSKDPSTQVGACLVNSKKRIIGVGYNGFPKSCSDEFFPWAREGEFLETKYPYVIHAEMNALLNSIGDVEGSHLYVTLFPCHVCAGFITQAGIKRVTYLKDNNKSEYQDSIKAAMKIFNAAFVRFEKYKSSGRKIVLEV
jgi:dCMP deaminase